MRWNFDSLGSTRMPLFTYLVSYKGATHVAQGSHSNFTGFATTWAAGLPEHALPTLTPVLRKELARRAYEGEFAALPSTKNVWTKRIELGASTLTVHAVQTER